MQIGYGVAVNPVDGSIWYAATGPVPGKIVRAIPGPNPPATCMSEAYEPPYNNPKLPGELHYTPRGVDVDSKGLVWTALPAAVNLPVLIAASARSQWSDRYRPAVPRGLDDVSGPRPQLQGN